MKAYFIIKMIDEYAGLALFVIVAIILAIRIFISYIQDIQRPPLRGKAADGQGRCVPPSARCAQGTRCAFPRP